MNYKNCLKKVMLLLMTSAALFSAGCNDDDDDTPSNGTGNEKLQVSIKNLSGLWIEVDSVDAELTPDLKNAGCRSIYFSEGECFRMKTKDGEILPLGYSTYCIDSDKTEENLPFIFRNENGQMRETVKATDFVSNETVLKYRLMEFYDFKADTALFVYNELTEHSCEINKDGFAYTPLNLVSTESTYICAGEIEAERKITVKFIDEDTVMIGDGGIESLYKRVKNINYKMSLIERT